MRTTVNIDDNLLAEAKVLAARTSRPLGAIVDDALRAMLRRDADGGGRKDFRLPAHGGGGLHAGIDLEDKDALAELLGDNAAP
ncbi:MAG: type II toxin-antitoxin system VapB family antitoxin [Mycobacterium sp.]|uniref:type II toxin-antitoxin system VapB family antitoxin n=1 Tax=Mycobacterium sp. TaxID=1785 RepID=UPI001ED42CE9|nr:type II toxin-antitoxin system VapB family antitoxin [Mycobacterium sp.]MBW0019502.1 type II toxin-antitoxin system VapB family antitoxin [Mycobacterium sp.]